MLREQAVLLPIDQNKNKDNTTQNDQDHLYALRVEY
jgi:hypothetical protein